MKDDDSRTFWLLALAAMIILGLGILMRWALTSWVGFLVVCALILILVTQGH